MDDALTPEELRLVDLLRQEVASSSGRKQPMKAQQPRRPLPSPAIEKAQQTPSSAQIADVAEIRQKAAAEFDEFKSRFSSLADDDLALLYQELEKLIVQAADLKMTVETYLRHKKADDARQAVSDMISKGIFFQKILIDDIHFTVSQTGEISLVSDPDRIKLSF